MSIKIFYVRTVRAFIQQIETPRTVEDYSITCDLCTGVWRLAKPERQEPHSRKMHNRKRTRICHLARTDSMQA